MWRGREVKRRGHEAEEKDEKGDKGSPAARRVERGGIIDGRDAEETHAEEQSAPDVPTFPETEHAEGDESDGENNGRVAVKVSADGTKDVTAIELGGWQEIERSGKKADPCGAADRMKQ
jgi:hypothetical protein